MASGAIVGGGEGGGGGDGGSAKQRWTESKVYTRKSFKGLKNKNNVVNNNNNVISNNNNNVISNNNNNNNNNNSINNNNVVAEIPSQTLASEDTNSAQQQLKSRLDAPASDDDSSSLNRSQPVVQVQNTREQNTREQPSANGAVKQGFTRVENRVKINLSSSRSKQETRNLRRKLEDELNLVRSLAKRIEAKEGQITGRTNEVVDNGGVKQVHSEVASVGPPLPPPPRQPPTRPLHQLRISVIENSHGVGEHVEKEKRTPKANQFYRNSEFLLAKDKFPPAESNKKSKSSGKKSGAGEMGYGPGMGAKCFKNCSALLDRLMKHKHGWVFNDPVDPTALGLHDYFIIIKHPMDLGTVKTRLNKNWYKSPKEFAEDVRLTFHNAMTYNPKGQDVHLMAEQLSNIFEEKWISIEAEYDRESRYALDYEAPTPTSRRAPLPLPPPFEMRRILDRSESMIHSVDPKSKPTNSAPSTRTPSLKKPKAKDPHKRDMTYEEKQKLSTNLQSLPSEKLDNIVQIIKKRNSALFQEDDEIEVDIDNVDAETLWELDRFVMNYKKSLSKSKRKAELAVQSRTEVEPNLQEKTPAPVVVEVPKETKTDENNVHSSSPMQVEKQGGNASRSSSSSSSSSDSGSSSSGSDSESSSSSGSDAEHSPKT